MTRHTTTSAAFVALLLSGVSSLVMAEPRNQKTPLFDAAEIEQAIETGFLLDLNPAWQPLESENRFALATPAAAVPGDAAKPTFGADEAQSAIARAIKSGYSVGIDPAAMPAEMNRGHAFTDSFKADIKAGFDAPVGDEMRLKDAAVETQLSLGRIGSSMTWSWLAGVDMKAAQVAGTNAITSGPQFKLGGDKLALTLKPQIAHTFGFGAHHGDEVAFAYAAGLKGELAKGIALGVEAYGATSNDVAPIPGMSVYSNRGSPALYVGLGLIPPMNLDASASKFSLEIGALTGMTETEQRDLTGRIKAAITW
ncbi:MAG: hypothetical protein ABI391_04085 [Hyphomicrobiaceae bacterium]